MPAEVSGIVIDTHGGLEEVETVETFVYWKEDGDFGDIGRRTRRDPSWFSGACLGRRSITSCGMYRVRGID